MQFYFYDEHINIEIYYFVHIIQSFPFPLNRALPENLNLIEFLLPL